MSERFDIDGRQAFRVQQTALMLFDQVQEAWKLKKRHRALLRWAASLHEAGIFLSYTGYHKHGAYLLTHMEMPGFSRQEQRCIAALVLGHRGRPSRDKIADVAPMWDRRLLHLVLLLRVAARIHRRRSPRPPPRIDVEVKKRVLTLNFPDGWLDDRPLTRMDLEDDANVLERLGYSIEL